MLRYSLRVLACALILAGTSLPVFAELPFEVGGEPPAWLGFDRNGEEVELDDYPERVRVVSFWASWCAPCLNELDVLEQLQAQLPEGDLRIFAVNILEFDQRKARRIQKRLKDTELLFTADRRDRIVDEHGISTIPLMLMIDHNGEIRQVHQGYEEEKLDQIIDELNGLLVEQAKHRRSIEAPSAP